MEQTILSIGFWTRGGDYLLFVCVCVCVCVWGGGWGGVESDCTRKSYICNSRKGTFYGGREAGDCSLDLSVFNRRLNL